jgi:type IV pilus assembly protein PilE
VFAPPSHEASRRSHKSLSGRTRTAGFTLIELMIAVAVVATLAAVALPSYQQYVMRSNRA